MKIGETWIQWDISFLDSFGVVFDRLSLYTLLLSGCLLFNGLFEAAGTLFGINGVPGIAAYRKQIFK